MLPSLKLKHWHFDEPFVKMPTLSFQQSHYNDVIMGAIAFTGVSIVYSTVCSGADQRNHQGYVSLAFVMRVHRWPVYSPHKGPATRKMFPFDDVIMPGLISDGVQRLPACYHCYLTADLRLREHLVLICLQLIRNTHRWNRRAQLSSCFRKPLTHFCDHEEQNPWEHFRCLLLLHIGVNPVLFQ